MNEMMKRNMIDHGLDPNVIGDRWMEAAYFSNDWSYDFRQLPLKYLLNENVEGYYFLKGALREQANDKHIFRKSVI